MCTRGLAGDAAGRRRGTDPVKPPARTAEASGRLAALGQSQIAFVLASVPLLAPCFWQSRVQAGDLSSHLYNAWLAERIGAGRAPGLEIAWQNTNVLFDLILFALFKGLGPGPAGRIAVALAVLVFAWGAFAFVSVVAGRRAWDLLPCMAMLAYGWVFHIGLFNFYLGLGFGFWALALSWHGSPARIARALPLLALAVFAHALAAAWATALVGFIWLWRRLPAKQRPGALLAAIALLAASVAIVFRSYPSRWSLGQGLLVTGADQLRVFDAKYDLLASVLFAVWLFVLGRSIRSVRAREFFSRLEVQLWILCASGVFLIPGLIHPPAYGHALVFISERLSLTAAVMICAAVASTGPGRIGPVFLLLAVVFFAFLYRDERVLNQFEDRVDEVVARLPPEQRVIFGVRDQTLRVNALGHMIDRACIGRCYSYANYEPSTRQFRIRAPRPNRIVTSTYSLSWAMQNGGYLVKQRDLPLLQLVLDANGELELRNLEVGKPSTLTLFEVFTGRFETLTFDPRPR